MDVLRCHEHQNLITNKLLEAFTPESLDVTDESHLHEGHAAIGPAARRIQGLYCIARSSKGRAGLSVTRMINRALSAELAGSVHALAIHAQAPGETG